MNVRGVEKIEEMSLHLKSTLEPQKREEADKVEVECQIGWRIGDFVMNLASIHGRRRGELKMKGEMCLENMLDGQKNDVLLKKGGRGEEQEERKDKEMRVLEEDDQTAKVAV